jgi:hypothetical protein
LQPLVLNFLRFVIFFAVIAALLAIVAVPALSAPFVTQMVRDAGVRGGDLNASIGFFDPALFTGRARELRIEGRGLMLGPATAGGADIVLEDVSLFERSFGGVRGNLRDVEMTASGVRVQVARVQIDGPSSAANVAGHFTPDQGEEIVRQAAQHAGIRLDGVELVDGGLRVTLAGVTTRAAVSVEGGGLVLRPAVGPTVLLLAPVPTDPWRLTEAWVSPEGITVRGVVDAEALARRATAQP